MTCPSTADGGTPGAGETPQGPQHTCIVLTGDAQAEVGPLGPVTLQCIDGAVWIANTGYPGVALVAGESFQWYEPGALLLQSLAAFTRLHVHPHRPVLSEVSMPYGRSVHGSEPVPASVPAADPTSVPGP